MLLLDDGLHMLELLLLRHGHGYLHDLLYMLLVTAVALDDLRILGPPYLTGLGPTTGPLSRALLLLPGFGLVLAPTPVLAVTSRLLQLLTDVTDELVDERLGDMSTVVECNFKMPHFLDLTARQGDASTCALV